MWLTALTFEDRSDLASGKSDLRLLINGACFLEDSPQELSAIQELGDRVKRNAAFFKGFTTARVDEIKAQSDPQQVHTYQTFQLNCTSERRL